MGGQALLPFTTTDVKDGEVIELADGKRYTVRYAGVPRFFQLSHVEDCLEITSSLQSSKLVNPVDPRGWP